MKIQLLALSAMLATAVNGFSQIRWDGDAGDGLWENPLNWSTDNLPGETDDVLFDNSVVASSYTVTLPSSPADDITVNSLTVSPEAGNVITVMLPVTNTSPTALQINGPGDAFVLNSGAVFINSSGATSGTPVSLTTTNFFRINNGGRYVHNTVSGHTNNLVARLSTAPGTENGIFEFDVPKSGYTISTAGRIFGTLVFSSTANGGSESYLGNSNGPLTVNGDLVINSGVTFTANIDNGIIVKGNFNQSPSSVFNLSNSTANTIVQIAGNILSAGTVTETGAAIPTIQLNGITNQQIEMTGDLTGDIIFEMNNSAGASLQADLALPYQYSILSGNITLGDFSLITPVIVQQPAAPVETNHIITNGAGSLTITGIGASSVVFPVGVDAASVNQIEMSNGGGLDYSVRVEAGIHPDIAFPLNAINRTWTITSSATPSSPVQVTFFYTAANANADFSFGLNTEVGQFIDPVWNIIQRNIEPQVVGSAYMVSTTVNSFNTSFALGNLGAILSVGFPVSCHVEKRNDRNSIQWSVVDEKDVELFQVQKSIDFLHFNTIAFVKPVVGRLTYKITDEDAENVSALYRIQTNLKTGSVYFSNIAESKRAPSEVNVTLSPNPVQHTAFVTITSSGMRKVELLVSNLQGKIIFRAERILVNGMNRIPIDVDHLSPGIYFILVKGEKGQLDCLRMVKQ
jgi:hypothetical protein